MLASKKASLLLKCLVSIAVLPDELGLHSCRGCYFGKRMRGCKPGPCKADSSVSVTPWYHLFSLKIEKISVLQCQGKIDVCFVSMNALPLCLLVTSQDFRAFQFCETGY